MEKKRIHKVEIEIIESHEDDAVPFYLVSDHWVMIKILVKKAEG